MRLKEALGRGERDGSRGKEGGVGEKGEGLGRGEIKRTRRRWGVKEGIDVSNPHLGSQEYQTDHCELKWAFPDKIIQILTN